VTLSLGIASAPENAAEKQALIDLADQCLYQAKRLGRNRSVTAAQLRSPAKAKVAEAG
jgi:PleD family two-component response regulator